MTKPIVLIAAIFGVVFVYACSNNPISKTANVDTTNRVSQPTLAPTQDELARGRELYVKHCAECHKESGEGGPVVVDGRKMKPDNLTSDKIKKFSDEKMLGFMVDGIEDEGMPSFKDKLSEAEMREVVKYIRSDIQKRETPAPANAAE